MLNGARTHGGIGTNRIDAFRQDGAHGALHILGRKDTANLRSCQLCGLKERNLQSIQPHCTHHRQKFQMLHFKLRCLGKCAYT